MTINTFEGEIVGFGEKSIRNIQVMKTDSTIENAVITTTKLRELCVVNREILIGSLVVVATSEETEKPNKIINILRLGRS